MIGIFWWYVSSESELVGGGLIGVVSATRDGGNRSNSVLSGSFEIFL